MLIWWRCNAPRRSLSCSRKIPERISQQLRFSFGKISSSSSLNKLAVTMSILCGNLQRRTSAILKSTLSIRFSLAFCFAVEIAIGSTSIPIMRFTPKRLAAKARMPEPVPTSTRNSGERTRHRVLIAAPRRDLLPAKVCGREGAIACTRGACALLIRSARSSSRSDIAVVACSPVPNAAPAGITRKGDFPVAAAPRKVPLLVTTSCFPILSGFGFSCCSKRCNQLRGNFTARPPNSSTSFRESFRDVDATSSCNCVRFGCSITASLPPNRARRLFSWSSHHCGVARLRHKYMVNWFG